jgi:TRAP transporter 4TM/12TM fusion protein
VPTATTDEAREAPATTESAPPWTTARILFFAGSLVMFVTLVTYFYTGAGGPLELATRLLPLAVVLWALRAYIDGGPYPLLTRLLGERGGRVANGIAAAVFCAGAGTVFAYLWVEFEGVFIHRSGSYSTMDMAIGLLILVIIFEISRKTHPVLFGVNVALVLYALFGDRLPMGSFFWHPGATWERVVSSSTVEFATGVFGSYTQMALTLIAAFLLLAAVAKGFGGQEAVLLTMRRIAGRRRRTVPLTAVLASLSIGMVSGSGAANTAVTGSFTIPLMKRHGLRGIHAGAIETSASMGGLILPPLMAVAGFIMADILGEPYWEVVIRGFAIAAVYFVALMLAVYLLSVRRLGPGNVVSPVIQVVQYAKTGLFFGAIIALIIMLGVIGFGAMRSALYAATLLFVALLIVFIVYKYVRRDAEHREQTLVRNLRVTVETFADLTWYLVLLLATLGVMIGLFTLTGFILRMGQLMLDLGDTSLLLTIMVAFLFGWLAGTGLPPTATYIIVAVVIVPPLVQMGIDPWVAHFFAFLLAIWGELSPPTSLTAAVASRIAEASFMRTMFEALKICLPIVLLSFAIFIRSDAVVNPGWPQIQATALLIVGCLAMTFATLGRFYAQRVPDTALRLFLIALGAIVLFVPFGGADVGGVWLPGELVLPATLMAVVLLGFGLYRCSGDRAVSDYDAEAHARMSPEPSPAEAPDAGEAASADDAEDLRVTEQAAEQQDPGAELTDDAEQATDNDRS